MGISGTHKAANRYVFTVLTVVFLLLIIGSGFTRTALAQQHPALQQETPGAIISTATSTGSVPAQASTPAPVIQAEAAAPYPTDAETGQSAILLSARTQTGYQLFLYSPFTASLTQLTDTEWDIIHPALSPDGQSLAFSSNLNGFWDLYLLDFRTQTLTNLTNSLQYEGFPAWSPDGQWIAYETYLDGSLEIAVLSVIPGENNVIRITEESGADHSPAWSPDGRYLLFTTNRSGDEEILRADLQQTENRFVNLSQRQAADDRFAVWSADGSTVYWSQMHDGMEQVVRYDTERHTQELVSMGSRPISDPGGSYLLVLHQNPNDMQAELISLLTGKTAGLPVHLPGDILGMTWVPESALQTTLHNIQSLDPEGVSAVVSSSEVIPHREGANTLNAMEGVNVPQPYLTSDVLPDFNSLRQQVEQAVGWNFLDILENAFIPITQPPSPEMEESWLYTGRAIAINTAPLYGGWMCVIREDFNGQTYWRVFLKTRYQDGSQGMPLRSMVWDFTTRTSGDTSAYEHGGSLIQAPDGYWVDFTALAAQYGWKRVPAVPNWRSYLDGALYNQYVENDLLSWQAAMRNLYPVEALTTATRVPTQTATPASAD